MRLVTDTNILVRCSQGRASERVTFLLTNGAELLTTDRNVDELIGVLRGVFGFSEDHAVDKAVEVARPFGIVFAETYEGERSRALARLGLGGQSDWPVLAASLALNVAVWSEDTDFFGTGVPTWTTHNVRHIPAA